MRTRHLLTLLTGAATTLAAITAVPAHADQPTTPQRPDTYAEETTNTPVTITIDDITPRVITNEKTITITARITNNSDTPLPAITATLYAQTNTPSTLEEISQYFAGERWNGIPISEKTINTAVPSTESRTFTITIDRDELPLSGDYSWGPRGITLIATTPEGETLDRSLLIWDSGTDITPINATIITPWTHTTQPTTYEQHNITHTITTTPGISLALPPEYLTTKNTPAHNPFGWEPPHTTPLPTHTHNALANAGTEIIALLPYDADPALIAASANTTLTTTATTALNNYPTLPWETPQSATNDDDAQSTTDAPQSTAAPLNITTTTIWPSTQNFTLPTLTTFPNATIIAPPHALTPTENVNVTPHPIVAIDRTSGKTSTTGRNINTTTVITQSEELNTLLNWDAHTNADALDRDQLLAATSALITLERPGSQRAIIGALPRTTTLTNEHLKRAHTFLNQRWVKGTTLTELAHLYVSDIDRTPITPQPNPDQLHTTIEPALHALNATTPLATTLTNPQLLTDTLTTQIFNAYDAGATPTQRQERTTQLTNTRTALTHSIYAEPSATINLINKTANFPIRVTNTLPWDATITASLRPSDPRLNITSPTQTTIPAASTITVEVPVNAIGAGDIDVTYLITTPEGTILDNSQTIDVRLRAGWEDALTLFATIFIAAAFVTGLTRTIRRRMRTHEVPGTGGPILHGMIPVSDYLDRKENE